MYSTRVSQLVRAPRPAVYGALLHAKAIAKWRMPDNMRSEVHEFDPREGGYFRVSLTYDSPDEAGKTSAHTDTYHGYFTKLVPNEQVVEELRFETDDEVLAAATITMTTTLSDADDGTEVVIVHEGMPESIPQADNETGTRMALAKLARLVEAEFKH
ncbi:MAG TPA: SRPBCC domain-containing protein [Candidatus Limnocylindrales bacterium]|nr:SRPBCC domain-containing protein [Candidatus Limnocylindrales bacterium]